MVQYFRELFFFVFLHKFNFFFHLVQNQTIRAAGTAWKQLCALCWGCFLSCMWLWWTQLCFTGNQRKNFFHLLSSGYWNVSPQNENQKKKTQQSGQVISNNERGPIKYCFMLRWHGCRRSRAAQFITAHWRTSATAWSSAVINDERCFQLHHCWPIHIQGSYWFIYSF